MFVFFASTTLSQTLYEYDSYGRKTFFQIDTLHKCIAINSSTEQSDINNITALLTQICGVNNVDTVNQYLYSVQMSQEQQDLFLNQLGEDTSAISITNRMCLI